MIEDKRMYWYNFKTKSYEYIETPSNFENYLPQSPAAQSLYSLYVNDMGKTPIEAATLVLEAACGKEKASA